MLASYLLDATRSNHPLEATTLEHLGYKALTEEDVCGRGAKAIGFADTSPGATLNYAGERADLALQLADRLAPMLVTDRLDQVYRDLERPLIPVLAAMERAGVRIDGVALAAQSHDIERTMTRLTEKIFEMPASRSTSNPAAALENPVSSCNCRAQAERQEQTGRPPRLLRSSPRARPAALIMKGGHAEAEGDYTTTFPAGQHGDRSGPTFFQPGVAETGRRAAAIRTADISIRTELGANPARSTPIGTRAHLGRYSQIELRVLAHLAGDETLTAAFRAGTDIHDQTALKVFGPASGLDPHELRRRAKIINYALLYGKTAFTLAKDIGVTAQAAQDFIDAYFAGFPRVRTFIDRTLEEARVTGVVKTLYGRRRLVPELTSRNGQIRAAAERAAVNMPIQGTAADIMKRAMIHVHAALEGSPDARMILTVHDELLFEVPAGRAEAIAGLVRQKMESAASLDVPLTVDVGIGENWKEAKS